MAPRQLALTSVSGFDQDIYALPDIRTQKMALDMLVLIRDRKIRGVPLGEHVKTGDLSDCYKLYFDPDGSRKPRFRLVYRYTPDEVHAVAIEAIAAGERSGLEVYCAPRPGLAAPPEPTNGERIPSGPRRRRTPTSQ